MSQRKVYIVRYKAGKDECYVKDCHDPKEKHPKSGYPVSQFCELHRTRCAGARLKSG